MRPASWNEFDTPGQKEANTNWKKYNLMMKCFWQDVFICQGRNIHWESLREYWCILLFDPNALAFIIFTQRCVIFSIISRLGWNSFRFNKSIDYRHFNGKFLWHLVTTVNNSLLAPSFSWNSRDGADRQVLGVTLGGKLIFALTFGIKSLWGWSVVIEPYE